MAWRLPPRLSRCRRVLPDDAWSGATPQRCANAALGGQPFGVVAGGDQQLGGDVVADAVDASSPGARASIKRLQHRRQLGRARRRGRRHGGPGCGSRATSSSAPGRRPGVASTPPRSRSAGPPRARRNGVGSCVISGEAQMAQLVQGDDPFRRRRASSDRQHPDRFDVTVAASSAARAPTRQRRSRRGDRVDRVGLAVTMTRLPVRSVDLDHLDPGPSQVAGQPGTIGAGALHTDQTRPSPWERSQPTNC